MDQKQKEEWLDLFAEAFTGIILPRLEPLENDVAELKKDVSELKKDVSELKKDLKEVKEIVEHTGGQVDKHEDRIVRLETAAST